MFEPSEFIIARLGERCRRLAKLLKIRKGGEPVPSEIIDREVDLVSEDIARWKSERKAGEN